MQSLKINDINSLINTTLDLKNCTEIDYINNLVFIMEKFNLTDEIFKSIDKSTDDILKAELKVNKLGLSDEMISEIKKLILSNNEPNEFKDLVNELITKFPINTPGGRILSPTRLKGIRWNKIYNQCKRTFKGKNALEELKMAITALEHEIAHRKRTGDIEYMNAIEFWLSKAKFEDDYSQKKQTKNTYGYGDSV